MNVERLLAHCERIADAPDAIPRLRRFILDLAVRGTLVPQDPKDEPVSELLKRIAAEKVRLEQSARKSKSRTRDIQSEGPFQVPTTWQWAPLGELTRIRTGKLDANAAVKGGRYPFFTCSQSPSEIDRYSFDTEAVLLAGNGDFNLKRYRGKFVVYQRTYVLEPIKWDLDYAFIVIQSQISRITENQRGSAISYLKLADIVDPLVPLPPLAEQHRIVAKVDELMSLCDQLEAARAQREATRDRLAAASLARLNAPDPDPATFADHARFALESLAALTTRPDQIKQLRQTILNLAVIGRLTDTRNDRHPALVELRAVEAKKLKLALRKPKAIAAVSLEEQWCALPEGWIWARWDHITDWITYGFTRPMPHERDGIPIVTGKNVNFGKIIFETAHRTSHEAYEELNDKDRPKLGDILVTKDGSIGRTAIVNNEEPFCINQSVAVLWLRSCHFDRRFLQLAIDCRQTQQALLAKTEGVAIKHISVVDLAQMFFPLPPLAQQHRIVAKVDELMALCDRLEANLATGDDARRRLLDALLAEALIPTKAAMPAEAPRVAAHG